MDVEYFHFLRPMCLLLLIPAAILFYFIWRRQLTGSSWQKIVDRQLLGHLLDNRPQQRERWPLVVLAVAMLVAILALAGPTWKRLPQQVTQAQDALLIVLDLSLSMRSSDVAPSRIQRAQLKLRDVLAERNEGLTALIAYAGDAHTVAPFTDDARTIESMLPALSPEIMPKLGNRPDIALELGQQLLLDAGIQRARVLLVTDELESEHLERMEEALASNMNLSVLAVGTAEGGPIPLQEGGFMKDRRGEMIVTQLDSEQIREASSELDARYAELTASRDDIDYLLPSGRVAVTDEFRETEMEFDVWHDQGALLALLLLPLCLLAFRRGLILPMVFIAVLPMPADAIEPGQLWRDLWNTRDQQASKALEQGEAERATELFKDSDWKASAAYRAGQFEEAAEMYQGNHYNRGNALAKAGKLEEAIAAYDQELANNPDNEDAAHNKKLLEEMKQQQDQQQQQQQQQQDQNNQGEQNEQQQDQGQQNQDQQSSENGESQDQQGEQQQGEQQQGEQQQGEQQKDEQQQGEQEQEEQQGSPEQNEQGEQQEQQEQEQQQAQAEQSEAEKEQEEQRRAQAQAQAAPNAERQQELEQWLRKVPDDPGGLLRNKFRYQYEQNRRKREHYDKEGDIY